MTGRSDLRSSCGRRYTSACTTTLCRRIMTAQLTGRVTIFFLICLQASAKPSYTVMGPAVIRPNRDYSVVVASHGTDGPLRLGIEVSGNLDRTGVGGQPTTFNTRQEAVLEPDSSQLLKFQMGDLSPGDYHLSVSGAGGGLDIFRNITALKFEPKSYSVFIETDRAIYKPGDVVKFRTIVVNPNLRPSVTGAIDVSIKDGAGNTVKKYHRVFTTKGVWSSEFQLASEPVLGEWVIAVSVLGQENFGGFSVAEFVTPKFEVTVNVPPHLSLEDSALPVKVEAYYPSGKPIKGEVTLQVTPRYQYEYLQAPYTPPVRVVKGIKGVTSFLLDFRRDLGLRGDYSRELEVTAYVVEDLTSRMQNSTSLLTVYRFPYKMSFIKSSDTFKPGLKYTAYIKVTDLNERPVSSGELVVRHAFIREMSAFVETRHTLPPSGVVVLEVFPPLERPGPTWTLAFEGQYRNLTQWFGEVPRARSPGRAFVQTTLLTPQPTVGDEVVVALNSTERLVYFVYEVLARGDVQHAATLQAHQGTQHTFRFVATAPMYPSARLVVHSVRSDGEVLADSLHFAVSRNAKDKITLSVTPPQIDVSNDNARVSISVSARPNSLVGVTAVDLDSLKLMGGEYRLEKDDVLTELDEYDPGVSGEVYTDTFLKPARGRRAVRTEMAWYGTATAHDVFQNAGVVVMTNALVYQDEPLLSGSFLPGAGPIDGRGWDPEDLPPAHNGPFGRIPEVYRANTSTLRPDLGPGLEYNAPPRPPLAGPYAFSFLPPPPDHKPRLYLSKEVLGTWLFTQRRTGLNGILSWQEPLPKALTSYALTAFAIDDFDGLSLAEASAVVITMRRFMVTARMPYSVVRGEAVAVEIVVFNYGGNNATCTVTIDNSKGEFLFPDFTNEIDQGSPAAYKRRIVSVEGNGGRTQMSFMIVPQKLGDIDVTVTADDNAGNKDIATETVRVRAEGHRLHVNKVLLLGPGSSSSDNVHFLNVTLPRNIVKDSLKMKVSATGDLLAGTVTNPLKPLLRLPQGCGEQTMASFVPILIMLEHLKGSGELSRALQEDAVQQLELHFQHQLTFHQPDGSFAYFDEYRDTVGSTWLTAFVAKTLRAASAYISVPREIITKALAWLVKQQQKDGSFAEAKTEDQKMRQNGAKVLSTDTVSANASLAGTYFRQSPLALTSYVLLSILTVEDYTSPAVRNAGNKALDYLSAVLQGELQRVSQEDVYGLAVATLALHVAQHPYRDTAFYALEAFAKMDNGLKWWASKEEEDSTEEGDIASSLTVEQTAYALLVYSMRGLATDSIPVARWLVRHRNSLGGFTSTQDTAVGLEALNSLSKLMSSSSPSSGSMTVRVVYGERGHRFLINTNTARVMQTLELNSDTKSVEISADGDRFAIVQLSYSYNVQVTAPRPAFSLDPQLDRTTDSNKLRLISCTGFIVRDNTSDTNSNMVVMEVSLPSGYVLDNDALPGLYDYPGVRRVERIQGGRIQSDEIISDGVAIYFDTLSAVEVCPTIVASRIHRVAFQKPTAVSVYDYYDLTRQARQFYDALPATLCDICDIGECDSKACDVQIVALSRQRQEPEDLEYAATVVETAGATSRSVGEMLLMATLIFSVARVF